MNSEQPSLEYCTLRNNLQVFSRIFSNVAGSIGSTIVISVGLWSGFSLQSVGAEYSDRKDLLTKGARGMIMITNVCLSVCVCVRVPVTYMPMSATFHHPGGNSQKITGHFVVINFQLCLEMPCEN